jgi:H+-transporting ATPase
MVQFLKAHRGGGEPAARGNDDVERGMSTATGRSRSKSIYDVSALEGMDEYTALDKFITLYRDQRPAENQTAAAVKRPKWWQIWKSEPTAAELGHEVTVPADWLDTDLRNGLTSHDVDLRRRRYGWNEITTEKVNFLKQFLSYFTGPVLYGTFTPRSSCDQSDSRQ